MKEEVLESHAADSTAQIALPIGTAAPTLGDASDAVSTRESAPAAPFADEPAPASASRRASTRATTRRAATPRAKKTAAPAADMGESVEGKTPAAGTTDNATSVDISADTKKETAAPQVAVAPVAEVPVAPTKAASTREAVAPSEQAAPVAKTRMDETATPFAESASLSDANATVSATSSAEVAARAENETRVLAPSQNTSDSTVAPPNTAEAAAENAASPEVPATARRNDATPIEVGPRNQWAPRNGQGNNAPNRNSFAPPSDNRGARGNNANQNERNDNATTRGPRNSDHRDDRAPDHRGLRFRGRDGRTETRGRNENAARNDNRGRAPFGRARDEGDNTHEARFENRNQNHSRLAGPRDNNRDRDDARVLANHHDDYDLLTLEEKNLTELQEIATDLGVEKTGEFKKSDLAYRILEAQAETSGNGFKRGILEILPDGKGFLRTEGYIASDEDVYVSQSQIKRFNLKTGDVVSGQVRAPKEMERYYGLLRVEAMNGEAPETLRSRKEFEKLTPIFPDEKFRLETTQENITARIIDLVSPIGKGQRGLIVAPPKAGKTTLIKNVANSIAANHPEVELIVLLIDERPEEVTDISRSVRGEVVASTFDELPENHMHVADMVMEKAKRMVEQKKDVVILLDSITRLSRASNLVVNPSGRTMSGGLDPAAMYRPKRMFGAARNIEEGGSLTILATALVDTGSRMDDYIFEEFKGTGNLDLVLDRNLFDQRVFPAIDINKSGTRRDDLLLSKEDLAAIHHLRRTLSALDNDKAINLLIDRLKNTKTNADFMEIVRKSTRNSQSQ